MKKIIIKPAILEYQLKNAQKQIQIATSYTNEIDIDIIDWKTSNTNSTLKASEVLKIIPPKTIVNLDLMQDYPSESLNFALKNASVKSIVVNLKHKEETNLLLTKISNAKKLAGISINPDTDFLSYESLLPLVDVIQIMTVVPGKQGNKFIISRLEEIKKIREAGYKAQVWLDGGINLETAQKVKSFFKKKLDFEAVSVGSALSKSANPQKVYKELQSIFC